MKSNYTGSPVKGNMKNTGMGFPNIKIGVDQVDFGGSPSIPLQGGEIANKFAKLNRAVASTPGIARYTFLPILGSVEGQSTLASLNEGFQAFWRSVRSATPHAENYQPGDFMVLTSVTGSVIYSLAYARAAMRSLELQLGLNTYVNDGIWRVYFEAPEDAEINDYVNKLPGWVKTYDAIINKMKSVPIPDVFPIFHRWEYMAETIFRDHKDETKAQYIIFKPTTYYSWELRPTSDPGTDLVPHAIVMSDFGAFLDEIFNLVKNLTNDSSLSNMFSDIVLTYPEAQWLEWKTLKGSTYLDEGMKSTYDVDVLYALHNAQIAGATAPTWTIVPKTGSIRGKVGIPNGKGALGFFPPVLNAVIDDNIDPERFTILSQWVLFDPKAEYSTSSNLIDIVNVPMEILTDVTMYNWKWTANGRKMNSLRLSENSDLWSNTIPYNPSDPWPRSANWIAKLSSLLTWAWAPIMRSRFVQVSTPNLDAATPDNIVEQIDIAEYAELERPFYPTAQMIADAHDAMRMGLWNLPAKMFNGKKNGNK